MPDYRGVLPRAEFDVDAAVEQVRPIVAAVADAVPALAEFSERFDRVVPESFRVPPDELAAALDGLDAHVRAAFGEAIRRRRQVAEAEAEATPVRVELAPGANVEQKLIPVNRVGLYVPGGLAPLASSVLMNVVPAQVAGVPSIAVASPPQAEFGGLPHPNILAVCALLGVEEVWSVRQAIAIYGVLTCARGRSGHGSGTSTSWQAPAARPDRTIRAGPTEIAIADATVAELRRRRSDLPGRARPDGRFSEPCRRCSGRTRPQVTAASAERVRTALTGRQSAIVPSTM